MSKLEDAIKLEVQLMPYGQVMATLEQYREILRAAKAWNVMLKEASKDHNYIIEHVRETGDIKTAFDTVRAFSEALQQYNDTGERR